MGTPVYSQSVRKVGGPDLQLVSDVGAVLWDGVLTGEAVSVRTESNWKAPS